MTRPCPCAWQKLCRKKALGSGPHGALQAVFTPDEQSIVAAFKDGSFYVWDSKTLSLTCTFTLPVAQHLRCLQQHFAISPDGQLLVGVGLWGAGGRIWIRTPAYISPTICYVTYAFQHTNIKNTFEVSRGGVTTFYK